MNARLFGDLLATCTAALMPGVVAAVLAVWD